ncbi:MAG: VOC family protein [Actinomycetota bacterium]|nr:VOC family protein [Actinomycetota bacterium]
MDFQGITWAGIPVEDFEEAVVFFRDRLGIPMTRINNEHQVAHFPLGNGDLVEVFGSNNPDEEHRRNVAIALSVEDIEQTRSEMEKAGVKFLTDINTWEDEAWCYFEGPDGLLFEIKSKPATY